MNVNLVVVAGRLTADPEVRFTQSGTAICSCRCAVNERYKDQSGEWQERPIFFDATIWGKRGEAFSKFHGKGDQYHFQGRLKFDQWEDKQTGQKRSKLSVTVESWEFVGGKNETAGERRGERQKPDPDARYYDDDPAPQGGGRRGGFSDIDDTPF